MLAGHGGQGAEASAVAVPMAGPGWAAEAEELSAALLWAVHLAEGEADFAEEAELGPATKAIVPCPPHHWLIGDHADRALLTLTCVRCAAVREQPRDPEPAWRVRGAQRGRGAVPAASFGGGR